MLGEGFGLVGPLLQSRSCGAPLGLLLADLGNNEAWEQLEEAEPELAASFNAQTWSQNDLET